MCLYRSELSEIGPDGSPILRVGESGCDLELARRCQCQSVFWFYCACPCRFARQSSAAASAHEYLCGNRLGGSQAVGADARRTIGTVRVARCNAAKTGLVVATMTSGASATNSAAYRRQ